MLSTVTLKDLLRPNGKKPAERKVWSMGLESTWIPVFLATNATGDTAISAESLGAPLRLQYDTAGNVRFSETGRPIIRVDKEINAQVRLIRENLTAHLQSYANQIAIEFPDAYKAQIEQSQKAGRPILDRDRQKLAGAMLARQTAEIVAQAEVHAKAHVKPQPQVKSVKTNKKAKPEAKPEPKEIAVATA